MAYPIDYHRVLNPDQLNAVMTLDGPVLVIAGAGSGKTRTLVYRVARLVEKGIQPEHILLLTFTRKAAAEMLDRASSLTDARCSRVSGGTFHSLCHRMLRRYAHLVGFDSSFTVLDRADMEEVIHSLVQELQLERDRMSVRFPKRATLANILSKSANLQEPIPSLMDDEFAQFLEHIPQVTKLSQLYAAYKRDNHLMDYDDLILLFRKLLGENETVREELNDQYQYVLVDEYQDTNRVQADIVKYLASGHRNIMVVGDDSQSIYSFRGANYKNMFDFPDLFPGAKIIKLEQNYRSTQPILSFTNAIMSQAQEKYTKCLFTERQNGLLPKVIDTFTEPEQAVSICRSIMEEVEQGKSLKDMAILFRAAYHSFELEIELAKQGIPFVKYGGFKFMESAHIKDLLAHLRVVANRYDMVSWGRILRMVKNIGRGKSQAIIQWLKEDGAFPWQVAEWPGARKGDDGLGTLSDLLKELSKKELPPDRAVELAMGYYEPILQDKYDDFPRRERDLHQLLTMAGRYKRVRNFLDDVVLDPPTSLADLRPKKTDDFLTLSTVHSAKGLEWQMVHIIWVMDGYFPSSKAYANEATLEEERRLMYVATTRAKDRLVLYYPSRESRPVWSDGGGGRAGYRGGLSSFIRALPHDVFDHGTTGFIDRRGGMAPIYQARAVETEEAFQKGALRAGDRVNHPAFGRGVISKFIGKEKVEVLFRKVGKKLLHLEYTTLEKM